LGREGIARVEETEKGLFISWIDNRPETLKRREAVMKKERQDKGDEEREQRLIQEQVERARKAELAKMADKGAGSSEEESEKGILERKEGEKVKLSLGAKPTSPQVPPSEDKPEEKPQAAAAPVKTSISFSASSAAKPKNIFATKPSAVKPSNAFATVKKSAFVPQQQKVSQQEMIMRREMEAMEQKKRKFNGVAGGNVFDAGKKQRVS
jgi:DNA/RNA-binding protein KIN17